MRSTTFLAPAALVVALLCGCGGVGPGQRPAAEAELSRAYEGYSPGAPAAARPLPPLPAEPTLSDYLTYAAANSAELQAALEQWRAAMERVPQAKALPDPRFTYRYYIEEVETRVGAQRQSFGIAQTVPWWGKLDLRGEAAAEAANAQQQRYQAAKLKLLYRVKDAYYEYYYLGRAVAITDESVRLLKYLESVVRTRYKAAAASHPDVIRAQVELGKLDDRLRAMKALQGPLAAQLNAAMNRPSAEGLPWPVRIDQQKPAMTDEQLLAWQGEANPELLALDSEAEAHKRNIDLARKDYFPDVTVGVDYIDTADAIGAMRPSDSGKDPVVAMVSINVPIWWDRLSAGVREARARYRSVKHARIDKANALAAELELALYRFHDAERKVNLYRDTLGPKAEQAFKTTEAAYRGGAADFTDLIDAQRILLEFQLAGERALADVGRHLGHVEMLVGREIPRAGSESPAKDVSTTEPASGQKSEDR